MTAEPLPTSAVVAVVTGGRSAERDRSLLSGRTVRESLERQGYNPVVLDPIEPDFAERVADVDVAVLAIAGQHAEDGKLQGLLESLNVPYTGSGVTASAVGMHKPLAKTVAAAAGVPVLPHVLLPTGTTSGRRAAEAITAGGLEMPVIIKPVAEGGSVGMAVCRAARDLAQTLLATPGARWMAEPFLPGASVTVAVLEDKGGPRALTPLETVPLGTEFYDYFSKRHDERHVYRCPPLLDAALIEQLQTHAVTAHQALGCAGYSRSDFIVSGDETYWLELNTLPGLSAGGNLATMAAADGITYDQLIQHILSRRTDPKEYRP
jgi:D-alanine-D-alanine ligase